MSKTRKLKSAKPYLHPHQQPKVKTIGQMTPDEFTTMLDEKITHQWKQFITPFEFAIDARDREIKYLRDRYNDAVRQIPVPQPSRWVRFKKWFSKK